MTRVRVAMSVSLDGFITGVDTGPDSPLGVGGDALLEWLTSGAERSSYLPFSLWPASRKLVDETCADMGAIVCGRRYHDMVDGWGGSGPLPEVPLFVLTHRVEDRPWPEYTYTDADIRDVIAQAREAAGAKDVFLLGSAPTQLALGAELLDEIHLNVIPTLLGAGTRLFAGTAVPALELTQLVQAPTVTHLTYRVRR